MAEFVFEIGTEEIPGWMVPSLLKELEEGLVSRLAEKRLAFSSTKKFGAPRRIGVYVSGLQERQEDVKETLFGPPENLARTPDGSWSQAALGFAKKAGVAPGDLLIVDGPKGKVAGAVRDAMGRPASEILSKEIPDLVGSLYLPKAMKWGEGEHSFVRPVRWVLALLDSAVVDMEIKGVRSSGTSRGHRVFGSAEVRVESASLYFETLRREMVISEIETRKEKIEAELGALADKHDGCWNDGSEDTERLFETVLFLCEHPSFVEGDIPAEFLSLPAPVLSTCLREHQKFFSLYGKDDGGKGGILPFFIASCDGPPELAGTILDGLRSVTLARLFDARFFFEHDRNVKLEKRLDELKEIVFHPKIGSYYDKARRMERYARELAPCFGQDPDVAARAALLSKCDLATLLVQEKEFTSLQGVAGGLYAEAQGEAPAVARAIAEHYAPPFDAESGGNPCSVIVALADRCDTLIEFFKIKEIPSGTKDPFGLRRAGRMVAEMLATPAYYYGLEAPPSLQFEEMLTRWYGKECRELVEFMRERLRFVFESEKKEDGTRRFQYDEINSVIGMPLSNLLDMREKLAALSVVRNDHREDFDALSVAYKRSKNILRGLPSYRLDPAKFLPENSKEGAAERALHKAYIQIKDRAEEDIRNKNYVDALTAIATLRPFVDKFFDEVLVMCDPEGKDPAKTSVQQNRLALLERLTKLFYQVADFSEIVPKEG